MSSFEPSIVGDLGDNRNRVIIPSGSRVAGFRASKMVFNSLPDSLAVAWCQGTAKLIELTLPLGSFTVTATLTMMICRIPESTMQQGL